MWHGGHSLRCQEHLWKGTASLGLQVAGREVSQQLGYIWKPFLTGAHQPLGTTGRIPGRPPSTPDMTRPQSHKRGARVGLLSGPVVPYLPLLPQVT